MNRIESKSLKEGMYFEAPVFLGENYILLTPDIPVSAKLIANLKKWGFTDLMTEGSPIGREAPSQSSSSAVKGADPRSEYQGTKRDWREPRYFIMS